MPENCCRFRAQVETRRKPVGRYPVWGLLQHRWVCSVGLRFDDRETADPLGARTVQPDPLGLAHAILLVLLALDEQDLLAAPGEDVPAPAAPAAHGGLARLEPHVAAVLCNPGEECGLVRRQFDRVHDVAPERLAFPIFTQTPCQPARA